MDSRITARFVPLKAATESLGLHDTRMTMRLVREGKLKAVRIGKRVVISSKSLDEFADGTVDELLTCEQAAAMLGISPNALAVRRYRGTGPAFVKLPGQQTGKLRDTRRVRYPKSCVTAWMLGDDLQYQTKAA